MFLLYALIYHDMLICLGTYGQHDSTRCHTSQVEAALAYDAEARKRHGAEAVCNFLATGERNPSSDSGRHELSATQVRVWVRIRARG